MFKKFIGAALLVVGLSSTAAARTMWNGDPIVFDKKFSFDIYLLDSGKTNWATEETSPLEAVYKKPFSEDKPVTGRLKLMTIDEDLESYIYLKIRGETWIDQWGGQDWSGNHFAITSRGPWSLYFELLDTWKRSGKLELDWWDDDNMYRWMTLDIRNVSYMPAPVPLPTTAALMPLGFGALAIMRRRRQKAR